ncbi:MAG TPA: hypothetical protein VHU23_13295 [Rhizomicrobium sp.]|nr:hypothetical protein [Rhizomicrobium sp.]
MHTLFEHTRSNKLTSGIRNRLLTAGLALFVLAPLAMAPGASASAADSSWNTGAAFAKMPASGGPKGLPASFTKAILAIAGSEDLNSKFMTLIENQDVDGVTNMLVSYGASKKWLARQDIDLSGQGNQLRQIPSNLLAFTVMTGPDGQIEGFIRHGIFSWQDYLNWLNGVYYTYDF